MVPNRFALLHYKVRNLVLKTTIFLLKCRGLQVGKGSAIGNISCEWPNNLFIGRDCVIQNNVDFRIGSPFNNDCNITIGNNVCVGRACEFVCSTNITIGNDCFIASNTTINDTGHEYAKHTKIRLQPLTTAKITIEDDVWIGTSCVIVQGVTIGEGSIIGAGSVLNRSIPPYEVWAGVPARFIKKRE